MPQLVKGGKYTFGWSRVGKKGRIGVPPEALEEYGLQESETLILVPGSQTSGGFGLGTPDSMAESPLGAVADLLSKPGESQASAGEVLWHRQKPYCWVELRNGGVTLPPTALEAYGVRPGDTLLVIRGSGLAIAFAVRGPIVEEARNHGELEVFESDTRPLEPA